MAELQVVLNVTGSILSTLSKAMKLWEQKRMNDEIRGELEQFVTELQYNARHLQEKTSTGSSYSNTTSWALGALQKDLEIVDLEAKKIINKGFIRSIWDANKTRSKLQTLRERVMNSFQTRLILALLDVAVESQQEQKNIQAAMSKMNKEFVQLYSSTVGQFFKKSNIQDVIRKEFQNLLNPLMVAMQSNERRHVETTVSMIRGTSAQTNEMEKFFEDVLAGLGGVLEQYPLVPMKQEINDSNNKPSNDGPKWYQDPITWETMCDPVKANDGHTYDRWTILKHPSSMARSPFNRDEKHHFFIERDDISIRSHLFQKFPDQLTKFKAERDAYRNETLQAVENGNFAESLIMLNNVLEWDPQDVECSNKRDHVQCQLDGDMQGTSSCLESIVGVGGNNSTSTSSSSSAQVKGVECAYIAPSLTYKCKSTSQNVNSARKKEHGNDRENHNVVLEIMRPEHFDRASVDSKAVVISTDGLVAEYKLAEGPGAIVVANDPCPSHCYPFYFEVLVQPSSDDCEQDVAIGFSIAGVKRGGLGTYSGSCGYYALQEKVSYMVAQKSVDARYPARAKASATSHRKGSYVVGAGFHTGIGIVFFSLDANVVAVLEATHLSFDHPSQMLFPAVSLHSCGAKVKANFGPTWVLRESVITRFRTTHNIRDLNGINIHALMTEQAVPVGTSVWYFEIIIDSWQLFFSSDRVSFGFAGTSTLSRTEEPGRYANSCGFDFWKHSDSGDVCCDIWQNGRRKARAINNKLKKDKNSKDYRVGVGIHYGTNEIFCTEDGCFLYSMRNRIRWPANTVVAFTSSAKIQSTISGQTCVGHLNWVRLPNKLQHSLCSTPKIMSTLDPQGLKARHTGVVVHTDNKNDTSQYYGVAAFSADMVAPLQSEAHNSSQKSFYFELKVVDKGEIGYIAIGFSHFLHFKHSEQLGCYKYSCAYQGNSGKLFTGSRTGKDFGPTFSTGDRVGAGFNHHTNTLFFVKNGEVIGCTRNMMGSCALYPAVGLGSFGEEVHLKFLGFDHPFTKIGGDSPNTSTPLCASGMHKIIYL